MEFYEQITYPVDSIIVLNLSDGLGPSRLPLSFVRNAVNNGKNVKLDSLKIEISEVFSEGLE